MLLFVLVLVHTPPQTCWPGPQAQVPPTQEAPTAQVLPQEPQLARSEEVATQRPLHSEVPEGHAQAPLVQVWPSAQLMPHPPQFEGFERVSTH